jgi:hypothetical protein
LLVVEILNALIHRADEYGLFKQFGVPSMPYRAFMHVDDLAMFVIPEVFDL